MLQFLGIQLQNSTSKGSKHVHPLDLSCNFDKLLLNNDCIFMSNIDFNALPSEEKKKIKERILLNGSGLELNFIFDEVGFIKERISHNPPSCKLNTGRNNKTEVW